MEVLGEFAVRQLHKILIRVDDFEVDLAGLHADRRIHTVQALLELQAKGNDHLGRKFREADDLEEVAHRLEEGERIRSQFVQLQVAQAVVAGVLAAACHPWQLDQKILLAEVILVFGQIQLHLCIDLDMYQQYTDDVKNERSLLSVLLLLLRLIFDHLEAAHCMHDVVQFAWSDTCIDDFLSHVRCLSDEKTLLVEQIFLVTKHQIVHSHLRKGLSNRGGSEADCHRRQAETVMVEEHL